MDCVCSDMTLSMQLCVTERCPTLLFVATGLYFKDGQRIPTSLILHADRPVLRNWSYAYRQDLEI